jgi:hypothetical protein
MLTRIKTMYHQEALTLLRWLAYARSPPTLGELVDAAIIDPVEVSSIDSSERGGFCDPLKILAGLVTIEEKRFADTEVSLMTEYVTNHDPADGDGHDTTANYSQHSTTHTRIRLAHFSVKEYLESQRILKSSARQYRLDSATGHRALCQSCLTYLRYYSTSPEKKSIQQDLETFPLLAYAAQSWFYHCALQHGRETGREISFLQGQQVKEDWLLVYDPDMPYQQPFLAYRSKGKVPGSAIYYASLLGLSVAVKSLLASRADVNVQGGIYGSALQAAAARGHTEIARLLVDNGADVNAQGRYYGSVLLAAAARGHTEIARLLVDNGADVNAHDAYYGSALLAATEEGHTEIA